ncbi:MAG: hypothetical protein WB679_06685 [Terracidiphilus sp.]
MRTPRRQNTVAIGVSLRELGYLVAQGFIETGRLGRLKLVAYKLLLQFAQREHQFVARNQVSPNRAANAPKGGTR